MKRYMLDTNMIGRLTREDPRLVKHIQKSFSEDLCISTIVKGEVLFGLAKKQSPRLSHMVENFLQRIDVLPWDEDAAERYGILRAELERLGKTLAPLDLLIAAHALSINAVLVTGDRAFRQVPGLAVEDWSSAH